MFNFFKINDPYRTLVAFFIFLIIRITFCVLGVPLSFIELKIYLLGERLADGFSIYNETFDYTAPLSALIYKFLGIVFGRAYWIHVFLSSILLFVQAVYFNNILISKKAYAREYTYLPSFFYLLFSLSIPDFFLFSPQLMSLTFLIVALSVILTRAKSPTDEYFYLFTGFFLGIATLFYTPCIVFFIVFINMFFFNNIINFKKIVIYHISFLSPILLIFYVFHLTGNNDFFYSAFTRVYFLPQINYFSTQIFWATHIVLAFWLLISFYYIFAKFLLGVQEKYNLTTMITFGIGCILISFIDAEKNTFQLLFYLPLISYTLVYYANYIKRLVYTLTVPIILIVSIVVSQYYFLYQNEDFKNIYVINKNQNTTKKSIMVLKDDLSQYANQKINSPFIDIHLSKYHISKVGELNQTNKIYNVINKQMPEVIIDDWNVMEIIFGYFPTLKTQYRKENNNYYLIKSE